MIVLETPWDTNNGRCNEICLAFLSTFYMHLCSDAHINRIVNRKSINPPTSHAAEDKGPVIA